MGFVSQTLRDSAKDQECTLRSAVCTHNTESTVLCHLPSPVKGTGNKGDDFHAIFCCSECHYVLDHHMLGPDAAKLCLAALQRTQKFWFEQGYIAIVTAEKLRRSTSSKSLPPKPLFERDK